FSAQSNVPSESLLDLLITRRQLNAADKAAVLQLARERTLPLEQAVIASGKVSDASTWQAMSALVELLIAQSLAEQTGSYKLTAKPGLLARMKGTPVEMLTLIGGEAPAEEKANEAPVDPQVKKARQEIAEAFEKTRALGAYEILGVDGKASADEIRKKYF